MTFRRNAKVRLWPIPAVSRSPPPSAARSERAVVWRQPADGSGGELQASGPCRQIEHPSILRTLELSVEPAHEIGSTPKRG